MKTAKLFSLTLGSLVVTLGGGYSLNKFIFNRYVEDSKILWETVKVHSNGTKECNYMEQLKVEEDLEKILKTWESSSQINKYCATYWSSNISGKTVPDKKNKILEYWIRSRTEDIINKVLKNEYFANVEVFEELDDELQKKKQDPPEPSTKESTDSGYTVNSLQDICHVDNKKDGSQWIILKCSKETKKNSVSAEKSS
ncbi:hypothetical protein [Mycoplasma suis]|uniref:Uncharacterized protein n=1 Tax=Mycoplasma suis (strain Illinois) TaxID=768700 RepID=F0QRT9_MYCSL|nr:hypothetical protein [Mycoplasma suis]ADX98209.1 hypothetical protein MSU_0678 [Mycoplasma suis str. Illinois]